MVVSLVWMERICGTVAF